MSSKSNSINNNLALLELSPLQQNPFCPLEWWFVLFGDSTPKKCGGDNSNRAELFISRRIKNDK